MKKKHIWISLIVMALSFALLYFGIGIVLGQEVLLRNIIAYIIFSGIVGIAAGLLFYFRFLIAFWFFMIGLSLGFFEMIRSFANGMSGWGDLIGILTLMIWSATGLVAGSAVQVIYGFYRRMKNK